MDYKWKTSFWSDFSIADAFGCEAVRDTYRRAFNEWKKDYIYLTEMVLVLNWKIWEHYQKEELLCLTYNELWEKAYDYATSHLKGDELDYFYRITD